MQTLKIIKMVLAHSKNENDRKDAQEEYEDQDGSYRLGKISQRRKEEHQRKLRSTSGKYKYYVSGHYPSSCLYLKTSCCLHYKTQRFRDWILPLSSGKTYSVGPN
jgi:hypothetical protein